MTKFDFEFKLKIVHEYLDGSSSITLQRRYRIKNHSHILMWVSRYNKYGIDGLKDSHTAVWRDGNFKMDVINWKKSNNVSFSETALHFNISNCGTIYAWYKAYELYGKDALFNKRQGRKNMSSKDSKNSS